MPLSHARRIPFKRERTSGLHRFEIVHSPFFTNMGEAEPDDVLRAPEVF